LNKIIAVVVIVASLELLFMLSITGVSYTLCHKKIPDIFDCKLKNNYQILIILVRIFLTQLAIKLPFSFPFHPMFVSVLSGENTTSEIRFLSNAI